MMLVFRLLVYACSVFLFTFAMYLFSGGGYKTWWSHPFYYSPKPGLTHPVIVSDSPIASSELQGPIRMFRGHKERTGFYDITLSEQYEVKAVSTLQNIGIHGASKSSPLEVDGGYLVSTDLGQMALVDEAGQSLWTLRNSAAAKGFHSTPALSGEIALAGDYQGVLYAVDTKRRELKWVHSAGNTVGASPLISEDGTALVAIETNSPDGFVLRIDLKSGELLWRSSWLGEQSHSSPALYTSPVSGEKIVLLGDNANYFSALDYETGDFLWRYRTGGPIKATPALFQGQALVTSWDGFLYSFEIETGRVLWRKKIPIYNQSSIAIAPEKNVGFFNSTQGLCQFDMDAETKVICEGRGFDRASRKASPIVTRSLSGKEDYLIWTPCQQAKICVYRTGEKKPVRTWDIGSSISGELQIAEDHLFASTDGNPGLVQLVPTSRH